jgi:hypothetical protein
MSITVSDYYQAREIHDEALENLNKETKRIVRVITQFFNIKDYWWSYAYYENADDDAPLPKDLEDKEETMPIHISRICDTGEWYYNEGFPVKFYDMADEEIVAFLQKEVDDHNKKKAEKEEALTKKSAAKKAKSDAIKAAALAKLTAAERKALKL